MTTELSQSQKNFDNLIMTQHLHKVLSAGHDYTSEDAPHSDRTQWYNMQTLIKLAQSVHNRDPKTLITHLAVKYNAYNGTHLKNPSYHRVWREPLLLIRYGGGGRTIILKNSLSRI